MTTVLARAITLAKPVSSQKIAQSAERVLSLAEQIQRGTEVRAGLLGIEQKAIEKVDKTLAQLKDRQKEMQSLVTLGARYKLLSLEPLTWRDKEGMPLLVIFSLDTPIFEIEKFSFEELRITPPLPDGLRARFLDIEDWFEKCARQNCGLRLRCEFEGVIPTETRRKIAQARDSFEQIFIIAEPKDMNLQVTAGSDPDPLVVGWDGYHLWFIDAFDVSSVEQEMLWASGIDEESSS